MVIRSINRLRLQSGSGEAGLLIDSNNYTALRKILKFTGVAVADDVAYTNDLIFNQGAFAGGIFAGDNFVSSYWGFSTLLNSGGFTDGNGAGNNGRSYDAPYSSFTINIRSSTSSITFDKRVFTVRPNGVMILCNDVWHITNDNINIFYFASNGTTFVCSGDAADNGFLVYSSGATGYANHLVVK
jgi:hypothetical protein